MPETTLGRAQGTWIRPQTGEILRISRGEVLLHTFTYDNPHLAYAGIVRDDAQSAVVRVEGLLETWTTSLPSPSTLDLSRGCAVQRYVRADQPPPALSIRKVEVRPDRPPVDATVVSQVASELARRMALDQSTRGSGDAAARQRVDRENTAYLEDLLKRYGWIDSARFGARASCSAAIFANHIGDIGLKTAIRPDIERDMKNAPATSECYMVVEDSLRLQMGERQLYGSQICRTRAQVVVVCAVEDPEHIDEYRRALGGPPLRSYLRDYSRLLNGGREIPAPARDPEAGPCP